MRLLSKIEQYDSVELGEEKPSGNQLELSNLVDVGASPSTPKQSSFRPTSASIPPRLKNLAFDWVVIFTPRGEACVDADPATSGTSDGDDLKPTKAIRMWVTSVKGSEPSNLENKSASLVQLNGITGEVDVFHP
jgi:hypothetical protein